MRLFSDAAGVEWQVFEVRRASENDGAVTPGRERGWLAFSSALERRRLAPIPPDWESVADQQLATLCATAEVVVQRHDEFIRERRRVPRLMRPTEDEGNESQRRRERTSEPTPDSAPPDPTDAGVDHDVADVVVRHARDCRANGVTVVAGMISLRRMLAEQGISSRTDAFKRARRLFVTAFYFDQ